jgi:phosphatidylserine decarboxylase
MQLASAAGCVTPVSSSSNGRPPHLLGRPFLYPPARTSACRPHCFLLNAVSGIILWRMRIPLTKYGWPQVFVFPLIIAGLMAVYGFVVAGLFADSARLSLWSFLGFWAIELLLLAVLIGVFAFFRDPRRSVPTDNNLVVAPADGRVTDIEVVEENDFIGGPALRIGIFLSIFDVHINRAPCNVRLERTNYRQGRCTNAMNPRSSRANESNDLFLVRTDSPYDRLVLRQISGAVARRIVCAAEQGRQLTTGEKFGMIKFGSRTELYIPARADMNSPGWLLGAGGDAECLVGVGDKLKAGISVLARYKLCRDSEQKLQRKASYDVCESSA